MAIYQTNTFSRPGSTSFSVRLTSRDPYNRYPYNRYPYNQQVGPIDQLLNHTFVTPMAGSYLFNIDSNPGVYITVDGVVTPLNTYRNGKDGVILTLDKGKRVTGYGKEGIQFSGCLLRGQKTYKDETPQLTSQQKDQSDMYTYSHGGWDD